MPIGILGLMVCHSRHEDKPKNFKRPVSDDPDHGPSRVSWVGRGSPKRVAGRSVPSWGYSQGNGDNM